LLRSLRIAHLNPLILPVSDQNGLSAPLREIRSITDDIVFTASLSFTASSAFVDTFSINLHDHITLTNASGGAGRIRLNFSHRHSLHISADTEPLTYFRRDVRNGYSIQTSEPSWSQGLALVAERPLCIVLCPLSPRIGCCSVRLDGISITDITPEVRNGSVSALICKEWRVTEVKTDSAGATAGIRQVMWSWRLMEKVSRMPTTR